MRFNFLSLVGLGFFALAVIGALRVRRDLAASETRLERALFRRATIVSRVNAPLRFWCAIALNTVLVLLFALAAGFAFRGSALLLSRL